MSSEPVKPEKTTRRRARPRTRQPTRPARRRGHGGWIEASGHVVASTRLRPRSGERRLTVPIARSTRSKKGLAEIRRVELVLVEKPMEGRTADLQRPGRLADVAPVATEHI